MTTRKALIVGATGLIGGFCLEALCDDPTYSEIIAIARKPFIKIHRNLGRVGETPKAKYLCTPVGKIQKLPGLDWIEVLLRKSRKNHLVYPMKKLISCYNAHGYRL